MNFEISDEQKMLQESLSSFIQKDYDFYQRCDIVNSEVGFSEHHWQTFAELGWLSIPFAEEHGGYGGTVVDTMLVMEQLGRGLVVEPYFASVLLFGGLVEASNTPNAELLASLIEGKCQGAFAYLERQSRFDLLQLTTSANKDGECYVISGEKTLVLNGQAADHLVVSARTSGAQRDGSGQTLFLIDSQSEGIHYSHYRLMDGQWASTVCFDQLKVPATAIIGELDGAYGVINSITRRCTLALCAEAVGIMGKLNELTIEYTKGREQFGVAISSFQALQHRMVDMFMAFEQTKSLLYRAVCSELEDSPMAERDLHALKVLVDRSGRLIGEEAIQLHGGMGLTEEMAVGHYVRRLMMINTMFGNGDYHQDQFNRLSYAA